MKAPSRLFLAKGHLTPDYEKLLKLGYSGVLLEIKENAKKLNTTKVQQTEFSNISNTSYTMIKLSLFQGWKDSSIHANQTL